MPNEPLQTRCLEEVTLGAACAITTSPYEFALILEGELETALAARSIAFLAHLAHPPAQHHLRGYWVLGWVLGWVCWAGCGCQHGLSVFWVGKQVQGKLPVLQLQLLSEEGSGGQNDLQSP